MQTSASETMSPVNGQPEMAPEGEQSQLSDLAQLQAPVLRAASGLVRQLLALPPERHDERTRVADLIGECLNLIRVVSETNGPGAGRTAAEVDAAAVCEIAAAIVRVAHARAASQIVVHAHAPTVGVVADRDRLLATIVNLAARTVTELPADGLLELTTSPVGTNIEIRIADSGVEIAPPDISRLAAGGAVDSDRINARVAGFAPILDQGVAMRSEMRLGLRTTITLPAASGAVPAPVAPQETESVPYQAPPEQPPTQSAPASVAPPSPPASTPEPRGSDERVAIIVDPDTAAAEGMAATLVTRGYATQVLGDASSTMDALSHATPDLALINLELPDINGIELIRSIRTRPELQALPIVAIAPTGDDSAADSLDAGATAYLVKPVSPSQIGHYAERLVHPF